MPAQAMAAAEAQRPLRADYGGGRERRNDTLVSLDGRLSHTNFPRDDDNHTIAVIALTTENLAGLQPHGLEDSCDIGDLFA